MLDYLKFHPGASVLTPKGNHGTVIFAYRGLAWVQTRQGQNVVAKLGDLKRG